jgi:hypothetical protein
VAPIRISGIKDTVNTEAVTGVHIKTGVNPGATEGYVYSDPLVAPVVLI